MIKTLMDSPIWEAIGWALLHSLWQFTLLAVLGWLVLRLSPKKGSAAFRYNGLAGLLTCSILFFAFTLWWTLPQAPPSTAAADTTNWEAASVNPPASAPMETGYTTSWSEWLSAYLPYMVMSWLVGIALLSLRQGVLYALLRQYRKRGVQTVPQPIRAKWASLQKRMKVKRPVVLLESKLAKGLSTFGYLKPIVLVPVGLFNQLSEEEAEALLLHELAHIRRNDYLHNLLLSSIEILFFYHPGVWWLSHRLKQERENCCDELVCQSGVDPLTYADALLAAARYSSTFKPILVMNADTHLSKRISRLLKLGKPAGRRRFSAYHAGFMLSTLLAMVLLLQPLAAQRSANINISMEQPQLLFVGVPNAVGITVRDVPTGALNVASEDPMEIRATGKGKYTIIPLEEGTVTLELSGGGMDTTVIEMEATTLPDPVASIAGKVSGEIRLKTFKQQEGIALLPERINKYCAVTSFTMVLVLPKQDPLEVLVDGAAFSESARRLIDKAEPGGIFYIDDVKCQCQHQADPIPINSLVFKLR
ncbi:MAG: M48 family metalloprotease [Bacteroidetes bacterium]|nr:M48 family metalloprotease [Bacteroidota bacterium]